MSHNPLIIYHADCNDGLTAAWAVKTFFAPGEVDLYAAKYQTPPPDVTDRDVIMVDFSYKRPVLLEMLEQARAMVILDHHKTAQADLDGLEHPKLYTVFDMERSGAGIAWDEYHPGEPRPWFVDYVEDNDLWRHSLPECKAVLEYIRSWPMTIETIEQRLAAIQGPLAIMTSGRAILRAKEIMVQQALTFAQRVEFTAYGPEGATTLNLRVCNVPFFLSSEVAGALAAEANQAGDGYDIGITYYRREDGRWSLSFRSTRDGGNFDVSGLATIYGGGGHRNAAGATVDKLPWESA